MTSKEALRRILGFISFCCYEYFDKELEKDWKKDIDTIKQDLERLETLEKENQNLHNELHSLMCYGIGNAQKDLLADNEMLQQENEKLKKALELACEMLGDWDCPVSQELIDDLDCEACCDNYKECWKKYFIK